MFVCMVIDLVVFRRGVNKAKNKLVKLLILIYLFGLINFLVFFIFLINNSIKVVRLVIFFWFCFRGFILFISKGM